MNKAKWLMGLVLGVGMGITASAQDGYWERRDLRNDMRYDYRQVNRLRANIARDRWQLNEDLRCGRRWAADRDRWQLERDQRALDAYYRDIRHDRSEYWGDRRW